MNNQQTTGFDGLQTILQVEDGNLITGSVQDCTPIMEDAKERHNVGNYGASEMKHAARLPMVLIERYCHINDIEFSEFMQNPAHTRLMLNDPDLSAFRIWPGKV